MVNFFYPDPENSGYMVLIDEYSSWFIARFASSETFRDVLRTLTKAELIEHFASLFKSILA